MAGVSAVSRTDVSREVVCVGGIPVAAVPTQRVRDFSALRMRLKADGF